MPNLTIIIATTRPGRSGLPIATWFAECARAHGGFDVTLVDLATVDLPMYDEPDHPRLRRYRHQHTRDWSATIEAGDAFVLVTAEYNHGYPAALKNAIDYLHDEWGGKPVGFVSYGGVSSGTRAVEQLKQVTSALRMLPAATEVNIPFHTQFFDDEGRVQANEIMEQAAAAVLDDLGRSDALLRPLRRTVQRAA